MSRINAIDPATNSPAKAFFEGVQKKLGVVPNLFRVLGNAPAALDAYLGFGAALSGGVLGAKQREQIALAVAEVNQCGYCLSAHTFVGSKLGLSEQDILAARRAQAADPRTNAILELARNIVVQRGEIGAGGLERARAAGLTDADIIETIANVALNIFSNYVNHIAGTDVDFPEVKPGREQAASCHCD
ncbi:MAG: carboxymuconolactone decarboxylase family protein [Acidobacteria bacterium]|nr:carboxymuconolactone decarboxylase family protein [Acidobacteriota bacterium]